MGEDPAAQRRYHCFRLSRPDQVSPCSDADAPERSDIALATLLPLLGCGEEAAALAFDGLADRRAGAGGAAAALRQIAREERVHDDLIWRMRASLPKPTHVPELLDRARRFHIGLARGEGATHLARIASLDSAVCTILSGLLRAGPIANNAMIATFLLRIRADEARHVRLSRGLALDAGITPLIRDEAAAARNILADILSLVADSLEEIGVDPSALDRDLRRLPDGLLTK